MVDLLLAVIIASICSLLHIVTHRLDYKRKLSIVRGIIIHILGVSILLFFGQEYVFYVAILYLLMLVLLSILLFHITLEGQTPIDTIFDHFKKNNPTTQKEITSLFNEKILINIRIHTLEEQHILQSEHERYMLTPLGKNLWKKIDYIFTLFSLKVHG